MRHSTRLALCCVLTATMSTFANAAPLKVVNVSAPAINCIFNAACKVVVTDSAGKISWPSTIAPPTASANLQSRTYVGTASATAVVPGAGKTAYVYRVMALSGGSTDCVTGLVVDFGPITELDYDNSGTPSDVFVVTKGSAGISSADKVGNVITFTFAQAICNTVAQSSYFFGLAAATAPKSVTVQAKIQGSSGMLSIDTAARVPMH